MKQKYNIQRNPTPLSDADIAKHQDFDALMKAYQAAEQPPQRTAITRRMWVVGSAVAAALVGLIAFSSLLFSDGQSYEAQQTAYFEAREYVQPPMTSMKPQFASYTVNTTTGGSYEYENATRINIPSDAFEDANGNTIEGDVNLFYREMHDYVDFFLSGIPMTYDSAGVTYNLESAGMIEIYAEKDGRRVRMAKDKSIDIELASVIDVPDINIPPDYNIYKLDTASRTWVYQEIDNIQLLDEWEDFDADDPRKATQEAYRATLANIKKERAAAINALENTIPTPIQPEQPRQRNRSLQTFDLDFLESFTISNEAKAIKEKYAGAIWQVAENSQRIPANADRIEWEDATLKSLAKEQYQLTLIRSDRQLELIVEPAVKQSDYQAALANYEQALATYETQLAERETQLAKRRTTIESEATSKREQATADFETKLKEQNTNVRPRKRKVLNKFKATSLGVWNCDRPIPPMEYEMEVEFVDATTGTTYENTTGYLVDKSRNTIYRFLVTENTRLKFNQQSDNFLWLVTANNEIAVFRPEQFKALKSNQSKHTFRLERMPNRLENETDIRRVLSI